MTPKYPIYEAVEMETSCDCWTPIDVLDVEGVRYRIVAFREPQDGEVFLKEQNCIGIATHNKLNNFACGERFILKPIPSSEPSEGGIQRRGDLPCVTIGDEKLWALVETACAVVNKNTHSGRIPEYQYDHAELKDLAAKLAPFTEPTPQPERFYVDNRGEAYYVFDRECPAEFIGKFFNWQDATDFAATKNTQEVDQ